MTTSAPAPPGLAPLVADLLDRARRDASQLESAAEAEGRAVLADTQLTVETQLHAARQRGAAEGAAQVAAQVSAARRRARARVLAAQSELYGDIRQAARDAVRALLEEDGNMGRLAALLRARLGGSAELTATLDGGLLATAPDGRTVDASVTSLADSAVEQLDLGELWTAT